MKKKLPKKSRLYVIERNIEILETLFPISFLSRKNNSHPAAKRWILLNILYNQNGIIDYLEQKSEIPLLGMINLESFLLVTVTKGKLSKLIIGDIDQIGTKEVVKKFKSRILDPLQFQDIMLELYIYGWHKWAGHKINIIEINNFPDLRLIIENNTYWLECKNFHSYNENEIINMIKKAESQIGNTKEKKGIVFLNLTNFIKDNSSDEQPTIINNVVNLIKKENTKLKLRYIKKICLMWDAYVTTEMGDRNAYYYFRKFNFIDLNPILISNEQIYNGGATAFRLRIVPRYK